MSMAADDSPLSGEVPSLEEDDPAEGEVLETPTEVRLLVGTLVELILAEEIPEPGPLDWKRFQSWRAGAGGRPTVRRGDGRSLDPATESRIWRATMEALYGWIPAEGQTEPPGEIGDVTNRPRALASYRARMVRQEELRETLVTQPAVRPTEAAAKARVSSARRGLPQSERVTTQDADPRQAGTSDSEAAPSARRGPEAAEGTTRPSVGESSSSAPRSAGVTETGSPGHSSGSAVSSV
jgi:hypothetical protein